MSLWPYSWTFGVVVEGARQSAGIIPADNNTGLGSSALCCILPFHAQPYCMLLFVIWKFNVFVALAPLDNNNRGLKSLDRQPLLYFAFAHSN